jgi:threonine/homoserine/homoserine lactone efflux protein
LLGGIACGLASLAAISGGGLGAILIGPPVLHIILKVAGTLYLLWLAIVIARSGAPGEKSAMSRPIRFWGGMGLLWFNPKGWAMTMGAAASFSALIPHPLSLSVLLGVAFGLSALCSLLIWCCAGVVMARVLNQSWQWRTLNIVLGALLAASILPIWLE